MCADEVTVSSPFKQPSGPAAWHNSTSVFLASFSPFVPFHFLFSPLLLPSWGPLWCLQPACTGLLIGNRTAAHLLIESRLGPWGRAVKQAPHGIKSWRLTGHRKSRAANSRGIHLCLSRMGVCLIVLLYMSASIVCMEHVCTREVLLWPLLCMCFFVRLSWIYYCACCTAHVLEHTRDYLCTSAYHVCVLVGHPYAHAYIQVVHSDSLVSQGNRRTVLFVMDTSVLFSILLTTAARSSSSLPPSLAPSLSPSLSLPLAFSSLSLHKAHLWSSAETSALELSLIFLFPFKLF